MPHYYPFHGGYYDFHSEVDEDTFDFNENIQDASSLPTERISKIDSITIKQTVVKDEVGSSEHVSFNGELFDVDTSTPEINSIFEHDLIV